MRLDILLVAGARPNFMKIAPVLTALQARVGADRVAWLHTGQHYDASMSDQLIRDLGLPEPIAHLEVGGLPPAEQLGEIAARFARAIEGLRPRVVAVPGDVTSTAACALAANKAGIPTAHIEAGLRSFDRAMPEEINRIVADHTCDLLLVTEPSGSRNLLAEGIPAARQTFTGNAMIDSLRAVLAALGTGARRPRTGRGLILVTLHRPANVDHPRRLGDLADLLLALGRDHDVVFPVHPRTRQRLGALTERLSGTVHLAEPLGYREFTRLMLEASLVVTDSGGVQEESAYLGVPCLTLRPTTERPITVAAGTNLLEPDCRGDLLGAAQRMMNREYPLVGQNPVLLESLWDGHAGPRIADALIALSGPR